MYKVQEIAEYVIYYAYTQGNIVTNLKLQKILYYVDACSAYSSSMLTEITQHQTPWIDAYHQGKAEITPESIRQFFIEKEDG